MKKRLLIQATLATLLFSCTQKPDQSPAQPSVIPQPVEMTALEGYFELNKKTRLVAETGNDEAERIAKMLADKFQTASGIALPVEQGDESGKNAVFFTTKQSDNIDNKEGYSLSAGKKGVVIRASEPAGLFYGMQTLLQLLPPEIENPAQASDVQWIVPAVEIKDEPRFGWRGLHLDVARHMLPFEFVKKYIDYMAMHKLNTFHWHLTDDQGWRIEIKQYPKLTEVGAWRKETLVGHMRDRPHQYDGQKHGGFFTQEEAREIVEYARERFITVVPEVDMPGHASSAIAAYPELGATNKPIEVVTNFGVHSNLYNVEESTFTFLENVLSEIIEIFPSEYIHIGGDEARKDQWEASEKIQGQIRKLGLKDEHELQSYFITRIEKFVNSKGRKIIGWDEILEGGLAPNAAVMSWRGEEGGIAAAKSGHYVVMTPNDHLYFDFYQGDRATEPLAIHGHTTVNEVYGYDPVPQTLSDEEAKYILGVQANLWTEYIKTPEYAEYMAFPRVSALAEIAWCETENKDWEDFKKRLSVQLQRYDMKDVNYSKVDWGD